MTQAGSGRRAAARPAPLGAAALAALGQAGRAGAQDVPLSYTSAQAEAGARAYARSCAQCHGANLDDGPRRRS